MRIVWIACCIITLFVSAARAEVLEDAVQDYGNCLKVFVNDAIYHSKPTLAEFATKIEKTCMNKVAKLVAVADLSTNDPSKKQRVRKVMLNMVQKTKGEMVKAYVDNLTIMRE